MLSRLYPILRHNRLLSAEAREMSRASLYHHARLLHPQLVRSSPIIALATTTTPNRLNVSSSLSSSSDFSSMFRRRFHALRNIGGGDWKLRKPSGRVFAERREYRKMRKRAPKRKQELELSVSICIEEQLPDDDSEIQNIAEMLRLNVPMAMKLAFNGLKDSKYKTRETDIEDVGGFETVELSVMLCNDEFICKLNKEWRGEDHPTDVLSMSQHVPELKLPVLMMGDIVISVETAARQAAERGHSLLDEIRILVIHGMLHLLGFDHELSDEAEKEMEEEEELLLKSLGWKGKGLIQSAYDIEKAAKPLPEKADDRKKGDGLRFYRPKFSYIFCDMDGTLLNSKSQVSEANAKALKEATLRGLKVVIATGKSRPGAIKILKMADLAGRDGIVSESSPGVFVQGLLVYGRQGKEVYRGNLDRDVCRETCLYSLEHGIPLIAFCQDRCLTLFDHPLVDSLHTTYNEPKAEIISSVDQLIAEADIQKVIFMDTTEGVSSVIRPYWSEATGDRASVVQAQSDMLEIVPPGTSKGNGVKMLLNHLGVSPNEIMAIGDGENDIEMLELASFGVAMSNGAEKTKAVADVIGVSNDEDGVADAIYRYAF
ncbi:Endoribonuclease YBEY [Hirschfeldia incana]|nr:Endoribonuclease YBEY [Hirschfeldia incana]